MSENIGDILKKNTVAIAGGFGTILFAILVMWLNVNFVSDDDYAKDIAAAKKEAKEEKEAHEKEVLELKIQIDTLFSHVKALKGRQSITSSSADRNGKRIDNWIDRAEELQKDVGKLNYKQAYNEGRNSVYLKWIEREMLDDK